MGDIESWEMEKIMYEAVNHLEETRLKCEQIQVEYETEKLKVKLMEREFNWVGISTKPHRVHGVVILGKA